MSRLVTSLSTFRFLNLKVESDIGAKIANAIKACNASDWTKGQERQVNADPKDLSCYNAQVPRTDSNIYKIENNMLLPGNSTKSTSCSDERPTALNQKQRFNIKPLAIFVAAALRSRSLPSPHTLLKKNEKLRIWRDFRII